MLCSNTQTSIIYCNLILSKLWVPDVIITILNFHFKFLWIFLESKICIYRIRSYWKISYARFLLCVCVCVCVFAGRAMHSLKTLKNILHYFILNHSQRNCSKNYPQMNSTLLVQEFNFRLWGKAPFPRAIFSSAAHISAAKNRTFTSTSNTAVHCSRFPYHRSPPSSAAQNRCCQPRGYSGPCGWSVSIAMTLTAAHARVNTSIWTNASLAAQYAATLLKPLVEKELYCFNLLAPESYI
jgi:hypothetical protein